jgi:NTP pyrophosphatase (non-canonical NTP hydrolase)
MTFSMSEAYQFRAFYEKPSGRPEHFEEEINRIKEEYYELRVAAKEFKESPSYLLESRAQDLLKEMADLVYVVYQLAAERCWNLDEALRRVHQSNLSKLGADMLPIRGEGGKILKGPNYQPPDLSSLV